MLYVGDEPLPNEQVMSVLGQPMCDIDGEFLGFMDIYESLARIIPKDWTIVDLGCAYAPQAHLFSRHKEYIGVDSSDMIRFRAHNTLHIRGDIDEFLRAYSPTPKTFAICSYVPGIKTEDVAKAFNNLYVFYPE